MSIDYNEEQKKLDNFTGDYWKPKAGQYKIKAISEVEDSEPFIDDEKHTEQPRAQLRIQVNDKEFLWNFPRGKTPASTFGQLIRLAGTKGNKLIGSEFVVVVVGEGQNIRFTIVA